VDDVTLGAVSLGAASVLLLALAWAIGVLGHVRLVNNYRAHPERYPDSQGLGRWMGFTLGAGGLSFGLCAFAWGAQAIGEDQVGLWVGATALLLVAAAFGGLARYRRVPPASAGVGKGR
jgi:hypothetical protein